MSSLVRVLACFTASVPYAFAHAEAVPGGVYTTQLPENVVRVSYKNRPVLVFARLAIVGIGITADPGNHALALFDEADNRTKLSFTVFAKQYPEQRLTIANPRMVDPNEDDLVRIRGESTKMQATVQAFLEDRIFFAAFSEASPGCHLESFRPPTYPQRSTTQPTQRFRHCRSRGSTDKSPYCLASNTDWQFLFQWQYDLPRSRTRAHHHVLPLE